jgi:hypothetical protein
MVRRSLVVAVSDNGVIGVRNALPWRLPSELKRFKQLTMKRPIIMGRRTYESIGRALPGRDNIVVTEGHVIDNPDVHTVNSVEEALALAERLARSRRVSEIMIIGGAQIFEQTRPLGSRLPDAGAQGGRGRHLLDRTRPGALAGGEEPPPQGRARRRDRLHHARLRPHPRQVERLAK